LSFARLAIARPVACAVFFLIVSLFGLYAYVRLPVDWLPDVAYPIVSISTEYLGVGPEDIERELTIPIEEAVSAVEGLESLGSSSSEGRSTIRLGFRWGRNLDNATDDIRQRLDRVRGRLPAGAGSPTLFRFDLTALPIMYVAVSGTDDEMLLRRLAIQSVKPRLERINGVAAVDVRGGLTREIVIEPDMGRLSGFGLSLQGLGTALVANNRDKSIGVIPEGAIVRDWRLIGSYDSVEAIAQTPISVRSGRPLRLQDVATVRDTVAERTQLVRVDGRSGLAMAISKQSGTNTVQIAERVRSELLAINRDVPGIKVAVISDNSRFIRRAMGDLTRDLWIGGLLAAMVILVFLRHLNSTLVVVSAIPISLIATFGMLHVLGLSLNTMSLGGLALGLGRLVDDAIVVIENIHRHRRMGESVVDAALKGTEEVSLAVLASTATTLAVFVPLLILSGMTGVLFHQLALVVIGSLLCSLLVAQALIPMLAAHAPGVGEPVADRLALSQWIAARLNRLEQVYARGLKWALTHGVAVVVVSATVTGLGAWGLSRIGSALMPVADEGEVRVTIECAPGARLNVLDQELKKAEQLISRQVPEALSVITEVGSIGMRSLGTNSGSLRILLKPATERQRTSMAIARSLRRELATWPGVSARATAGGGNRFLSMLTGGGAAQVTVQIRGEDPQVAAKLAEDVLGVLQADPNLANAELQEQPGQPVSRLRLDALKQASNGIFVDQVANALSASANGWRASLFREPDETLDIWIRLPKKQSEDTQTLLNLPVSTGADSTLPLGTLVRVDERSGPSVLTRDNQSRMVEVGAEWAGEDLDKGLNELKTSLSRLQWPRGFSYTFGGDFEAAERSTFEFRLALGFALLLLYLVMAAQFESWIDPLVILFAIPAAISGVAASMLLTQTSWTMQAGIGVIVLAGIAVSNGIVLVDRMNQLRRQGALSLSDAIQTAASTRMRPVLMTSLVTILALLPMAFALGEGAELQSPMARVVCGGLLSSTAITLFLIPVLYAWVHRKEN
jgi:HAE1 family hydrophobic/amphiphilic exporter-1